MQDKIPLPTDNIYKFYALFGLIIMLTSSTMFFIRHKDYNQAAFERYIPMELLKSETNLSAENKIRLNLLTEQAKIDKEDQKLELGIYMNVFLLGIVLSIYGFTSWHKKIQPKQDELLDLQIKKLKFEVEMMIKQ